MTASYEEYTGQQLEGGHCDVEVIPGPQLRGGPGGGEREWLSALGELSRQGQLAGYGLDPTHAQWDTLMCTCMHSYNWQQFLPHLKISLPLYLLLIPLLLVTYIPVQPVQHAR